VRMKAGELLAAQRNLSVTDDLLRVNREGLSVVGNRVREGAAPSLDESLQLVEVNRLDAGRQLAQSRVDIAMLQLKALVGMPPDAKRNEGNIAAAMAGVRAAERRVEFTVLTVQQEVAAAFAQYEAARRSVDLYERGVRDVARRNLDVVRQAYRLGRGSLLDVVAEQRRYIEIENGYTDALKQVYDAAVDIERAVGTAGR